MKNILVTGVNGQVGSELKRIHSKHQSYRWFFTDRTTLDISDELLFNSFIEKNNIDIIINCAAYTNVELAEKEIDKADIINNLSLKNISTIVKRNNIKFVHISTDSVFDGKKNGAYSENDRTNPLNVYSKSKLDGENQIKKINPQNTIILRVSWVYSIYGKNFVKTMLKLFSTQNEVNIVYDQIGTPTHAADIAKVIMDLIPSINNQDVEVYHYCSNGATTWYDFAIAIADFFKINCKINPIESKDYGSNVLRPYSIILNKNKIKEKFNIHLPYWKDSLYNCLSQLEITGKGKS